MKLIVSTHQGVLYNEEVEYIVVHNQDGEFAIMNDHVPVIAVIDNGFIKLVKQSESFFIAVTNGILEFHENIVSVLSQEAQIGNNKEDAKTHLEGFRKERLEKNRKEEVDFTQKEKELREHLRTSKAGQL